jgi:hypothetical protein
MNKCLDHFRQKISERTDPEGRKRDVCWWVNSWSSSFLSNRFSSVLIS